MVAAFERVLVLALLVLVPAAPVLAQHFGPVIYLHRLLLLLFVLESQGVGYRHVLHLLPRLRDQTLVIQEKQLNL